jgi:predicted TIM-barrel fold metal-dependent hydrolase
VEQLMLEPKIDAHAHFMALAQEDEARFIAALEKHNVTWLTICTAGTEWDNMRKQIELAKRLHSAYPGRVAWAVSFNLENWGAPDWLEQAIATIDDGIANGAIAVKLWKDLGMVLKDPDGGYVMVDDPRLSPVLEHVESRGLTLVTHIGEPYNCWQPLEKMTNDRSVEYFGSHPEYHGYLHPEVPDYWAQINARDNLLAQHPGLRVVGAHLASLEWNLDELAKRLERFPNLAADLAERIYNLQEFERDKVREFVLKYQDRILYGTDNITGWSDSTATDIAKMDNDYKSDYSYFATDEEVQVPWISPDTVVNGLALPAPVLRKIFYENAKQWYPGI